jgi:hypothetical protein
VSIEISAVSIGQITQYGVAWVCDQRCLDQNDGKPCQKNGKVRVTYDKENNAVARRASLEKAYGHGFAVVQRTILVPEWDHRIEEEDKPKEVKL